MKQNQTFSMGHIQIWHHVFFYQKLLKYFNGFQNQNLSLLWLKWNQTMEMKQNQTFFHRTYSNLTPYLSLSKNIRVFQWLLKSKFLSFKTKVNRKNKNETTSDIFHGRYSNLTPLKHFNDIQNQNLSFLCLKWTQTMEIKQNQTFFPWDITK